MLHEIEMKNMCRMVHTDKKLLMKPVVILQDCLKTKPENGLHKNQDKRKRKTQKCFSSNFLQSAVSKTGLKWHAKKYHENRKFRQQKCVSEKRKTPCMLDNNHHGYNTGEKEKLMMKHCSICLRHSNLKLAIHE